MRRRIPGDAAGHLSNRVCSRGVSEPAHRPRRRLGRRLQHEPGRAADALRAKGVKRVGPMMVTRCMASTVSACLATVCHQGVNYSITSACSTSAHCISHAAQLIAWGQQMWSLLVVAGRELGDVGPVRRHGRHVRRPAMTTPSRAPFDTGRDGFVIAGGGGVTVLWNRWSTPRRARHHPRGLVGFGATSDGHDMVAPSGEGAVALHAAGLAPSGAPWTTSTPRHLDPRESTLPNSARCAGVFGANADDPAPTKSISGHSLGAAGVQKAIYSLLMLQGGYATASPISRTSTPPPKALVLREAPRRRSTPSCPTALALAGRTRPWCSRSSDACLGKPGRAGRGPTAQLCGAV